MIVDGKKLAGDIVKNLAQRGIHKTLGVVFVGDDPVSKSFTRIKEQVGERVGVSLVIHKLPKDSKEKEVIQLVKTIGNDKNTDGLIVQLPLPNHINTDVVLEHIPTGKDVDSLRRDSEYVAPVARAIEHVFKHHRIDILNKKILVVGQGILVGLPVTKWLQKLNTNVTTSDITTTNLAELTRYSDIIITGAGSPNLIKPEMVKNGVILIDAGTSESSGKLVGDIDPSCYEKAALYSPVPGGIGPLTVAMLFANLLDA